MPPSHTHLARCIASVAQRSLLLAAQAASDESLPRGAVKACTQCGTTKTPQWREGPLGPKTLCNACGVKIFRANKRVDRPAGREEEAKHRKPAIGVKRKVRPRDEERSIDALLPVPRSSASSRREGKVGEGG